MSRKFTVPESAEPMRDAVLSLADSQGWEYSISRTGELIPSTCPVCDGGDSRDRRTFAINLISGLSCCKRGSCGWEGNFNSLQRKLGIPDDGIVKVENKFTKSALKELKRKEYVKPKLNLLPPTEEIIDYFASRKISEATMKAFDVSTVDTGVYAGDIVFPFYLDSEKELIYVKYRKPRKWYKGCGWSKEMQESNTMSILQGMHMCTFDEPLIITEGAIDLLSLYEAGIRNVVSVPSGANDVNWIEHCWDWLENFTDIILFGDNDEPGRKMIDDIIKRLTGFNCMIVKDYPMRPDGITPCKDANEVLYFHGDFALWDMIESAEGTPLKGVINLADVVPVDPTKIPRVKTNIPTLDKTLGGIAEGTVTIFTGASGAGKLLDNNTPVMTRNGWKRHGDLVVGDLVLNHNKEYVRVTRVFPKHVANLEATFSNGEVIRCHEEHEWPLKTVIKGLHNAVECGIIKRMLASGGHVRLIDGTSFVEIKEIEPVPGNCIQVDGGIYLVGKTMIPTHNSTVTGQLLLSAIEQGNKVCVYSGELGAIEVQSWLHFQAAGSEYITLKYDPVAGCDIPYIDEGVQERLRAWYDGKLYMFDDSQFENESQLDSILGVFKMLARRVGVKMFLVDNVLTVTAEDNEEFKAQGRLIVSMKHFAKRYGVSVLIVAHPRKKASNAAQQTMAQDDVGGNGALVRLADNVITVERPDLRVIKNRKTGVNTLISCVYCPDSRRIYERGVGDINTFSWDKEGAEKPAVRADSLPEYREQASSESIPF